MNARAHIHDHSPATEHEREIWDYLNRHPQVLRSDILRDCSPSEHKCDQYLRKLRKLGILTLIRREGSKAYYTIFGTNQLLEYAAGKRQSKEAAIWQAMRMLGVFTTEDLCAALAAFEDIKKADVRAYALMLGRAKYLTVMMRDPQNHIAVRWRLTKDSGPLPPVQKRITAIVDNNEDRIVYARGERL